MFSIVWVFPVPGGPCITDICDFRARFIALSCEALEENGAIIGFEYSLLDGLSFFSIVESTESSLISKSFNWETIKFCSSLSDAILLSSISATSIR